MIDNPSEKHKQMVTDFQTNKITMEELEKECAYWFLDCFLEIRVRPMPSMPPDLAEYYAMPQREKNKTSAEFWKLNHIKNYMDQASAVSSENKARLIQLTEFKELIPQEDAVNRDRYQDKINEFKSILNVDKDPVPHWSERY